MIELKDEFTENLRQECFEFLRSVCNRVRDKYPEHVRQHALLLSLLTELVGGYLDGFDEESDLDKMYYAFTTGLSVQIDFIKHKRK